MDNKDDYYVIYCINNYHNIYMDYRGEGVDFELATRFRDPLDAHQFLRQNRSDTCHIWAVFHISELDDDRKKRKD